MASNDIGKHYTEVRGKRILSRSIEPATPASEQSEIELVLGSATTEAGSLVLVD